MRCGTFLELTLESGETKTTDAVRGSIRSEAGSVVCWALVTRPCWAYAARTRPVGLGSRATEVSVRVGRVRGALTMRAPESWESDARRALATRCRAHAEWAVALLARRSAMRAMPREVLTMIAGHLASMCELNAP
jgi:hypothetical protein